MTKPENLFVDGEVLEIKELDKDLYGISSYVHGANMNLSPHEAEQLRDWLTSYLKWYYQED